MTQEYNTASSCNLDMVTLPQRSSKQNTRNISDVFLTSLPPFRHVSASPHTIHPTTWPELHISPSFSCPWRAVCGLFHSAPANQSCCRGWLCQRCGHQQDPLKTERKETVNTWDTSKCSTFKAVPGGNQMPGIYLSKDSVTKQQWHFILLLF